MISSLKAFFAQLEFREVWLLLSCLSAFVVLGAAWLPRGRLIFSSFALLPDHRGSWRTRTAWLPGLLLALAALLLGVALAGPRRPDKSQRIEREGIAIMMAVDISGSMRALDLSEKDKERTRLDAVMQVFNEFVSGDDDELGGRIDDAIGIVSFAAFADTRCPLTLDHDILKQVADRLEIVTSQRENGTALGDGLGLAAERLRESKAKSKVIILLTDGVNNAGEEPPMAAAELASQLGIKVYTIGAGTNGMAPVRMPDPFTGRQVLRQVPVEIDEETLEAIAEHTGGRYFRATDAATLRKVYAQIDELERSKISDERYRKYSEYFRWVAGLALLLMALGWLLQSTVYRRLP